MTSTPLLNAQPSLRHRLEYGVFRLLDGILGRLPMATVQALGEGAGSLFYLVDPRHRRIVRENLRCADLGLSEAAPDTIRRAHRVHPIAALQTEYSLWTRDPEEGILETVRELGIGFVAYSPLGRGFLTGRFRSATDFAPGDWRQNHPRFSGDNFERNQALADRVQQIAREKGVTPAQLALAWVLARGKDIVPIPGTKHRKYLDDNVKAADLTLTPDDMRRLDEEFPKGAAAGLRYPEGGMKTVNR